MSFVLDYSITMTWNERKGINMILNIDDSSLGNPGVSGFGGFI